MHKTYMNQWESTVSKLFLSVFLMVFVSIACGDVAGSKLSVLKDDSAGTSGWKSIVNETFKFSLHVPASSRVESHRLANNAEYIRIQNYRPSDGNGLKPNMYWLEIFIFDHQAKRKIWEPCTALILNPTTDAKAGLNIYRGHPRDKSPDAGGFTKSLCAEAGEFDVYLQASEGNKETPILNKIYGSLRVTPRR